MTLTDFRRRARREHLDATIISDGCREYVVEVRCGVELHAISDRRGRRKRFASLAEAKHAVKRARSIELAVRIAADEACASQAGLECGFSRIALGRPGDNAGREAALNASR